MDRLKELINQQIYEDIKYISDAAIDWKKLHNKTILVTGANGFIAYYLILALMLRNDRYQENINIIGLVRNRKKALDKYKKIAHQKDLHFVEADVCESMDAIGHADYIIHAASQATPYYFEHDPVGTLEANTTGTTNVLKYAIKEKPDAVLMISSLKVYGMVSKGQCKICEEDMGYLDINSYKNCYAAGKRTMETLCCSYWKQYGINIKIARPSYIYGASTLEDDRVWAQFLANIVRRENILLKSNGAAYRSFCYVADTVTALLTIMLSGESGQPYNISVQASDTTIRDFAKTAVHAFPDRNMSLIFEHKEDEKEPQPVDPHITPEILDNSRLKALGWVGGIDLMEGIRRAVKTMECQPD